MKLSALLALTVGTFAIGTDLYLVSGILPSLAQGLDTNPALAGQLATLFALTHGLAAPVLATFVSGLPRKTVLASSLGLFAVGNILCALAPGFETLAAARIFTALSACLFVPNAAAMVVAVETPARRGASLGAVMAGLNLATVAGVPLGIAVNSLWGWRGAFGFVALLTVISALGVLWKVPEVDQGPKTTLGARLSLLKVPALWPILGTTFLTLAGAFSLYTYLAVEFHDALGIGPAAFALTTSLYGILGIFGAWTGGSLGDNLGAEKTLLLTLGILVLVFAGMGASGTMAAPMVGLLLAWGFVGAFFTPVQQLRVAAAVPQAAPGGLALHSSAIYLGQALAGAVGGWTVADLGPQFLGWVAAAFVVAAILLFALTRKGKTQHRAGMVCPPPDSGAVGTGCR